MQNKAKDILLMESNTLRSSDFQRIQWINEAVEYLHRNFPDKHIFIYSSIKNRSLSSCSFVSEIRGDFYVLSKRRFNTIVILYNDIYRINCLFLEIYAFFSVPGINYI